MKPPEDPEVGMADSRQNNVSEGQFDQKKDENDCENDCDCSEK